MHALAAIMGWWCHRTSPDQQVLEGNTPNVDVTAPGAILALAMMYLQSNNEAVAARLAPPATHFALEFVRPDFILLRVLACSLILWDSVRPSDEWVAAQVPGIIRAAVAATGGRGKGGSEGEDEEGRGVGKRGGEGGGGEGGGEGEADVDEEAMALALCNVLAGCCLALGELTHAIALGAWQLGGLSLVRQEECGDREGLRYAGSANGEAEKLLRRYALLFFLLRERRPLTAVACPFAVPLLHWRALLDARTLDTAVNAAVLSLSLVRSTASPSLCPPSFILLSLALLHFAVLPSPTFLLATRSCSCHFSMFSSPILPSLFVTTSLTSHSTPPLFSPSHQVMAGTGHLPSLRLLRFFHRRTAAAADAAAVNAATTYGSHMAVSMAIGFLGLSACQATFSTSPPAVAALLLALFPHFPSSPADHRCHLQVSCSLLCRAAAEWCAVRQLSAEWCAWKGRRQAAVKGVWQVDKRKQNKETREQGESGGALRHFWVLAVEERAFVEAVDVDTWQPVIAPLHLTLKSSDSSTPTALSLHTPCLLPPLPQVLSPLASGAALASGLRELRLCGGNFWPLRVAARIAGSMGACIWRACGVHGACIQYAWSVHVRHAWSMYVACTCGEGGMVQSLQGGGGGRKAVGSAMGAGVGGEGSGGRHLVLLVKGRGAQAGSGGAAAVGEMGDPRSRMGEEVSAHVRLHAPCPPHCPFPPFPLHYST
ncbi:unnamed protein product [Closterium sp. NIES-64]|nr:unnamed protein product [Closterium sp. NIES-64]